MKQKSVFLCAAAYVFLGMHVTSAEPFHYSVSDHIKTNANHDDVKSAWGTANFKICLENVGRTYNDFISINYRVVDTDVIGLGSETFTPPFNAGEVRCSKTYTYDIWANGYIIADIHPKTWVLSAKSLVDFNGESTSNDWVHNRDYYDPGDIRLGINRPGDDSSPSALYDVEDEDTVFITRRLYLQGAD